MRSIVCTLFGIVLLGVSVSAVAAGGLPLVYGIQLGGAQTLPSCNDKAVQDSSKGWVEYTQACSIVLLEGRPEWLQVKFPLAERPALSSNGEVGLTVRDGVIHSIQWGTKGVYDAREVVAALKKKFGTPSKTEKSAIQTPQGVVFDGWVMKWERPGYVVHYATIGFARLLHEGSVSVRTLQEERRTEEAASKRAL